MPLLISHVDLRVRDRAKATEFYDAILNLLGATKDEGKNFTTWQIPPADAPPDWEADAWFGITEDAAMTPGSARIAFDAPSRGTVDAIATYLPAIGATNIEWTEGMYGPNYHAVFFEDPDGNKLEVCHIGE
ncbi:MAG TPA: VOC family protein [Candidatus Elarobacter sp.]|nr:VOC family protein [Candidatus Elarobacter sp.]